MAIRFCLRYKPLNHPAFAFAAAISPPPCLCPHLLHLTFFISGIHKTTFFRKFLNRVIFICPAFTISIIFARFTSHIYAPSKRKQAPAVWMQKPGYEPKKCPPGLKYLTFFCIHFHHNFKPTINLSACQGVLL